MLRVTIMAPRSNIDQIQKMTFNLKLWRIIKGVISIENSAKNLAGYKSHHKGDAQLKANPPLLEHVKSNFIFNFTFLYIHCAT